MNYQFARPIEYRVIRIIFGPTRSYFASKIRVEVLVYIMKCMILSVKIPQ